MTVVTSPNFGWDVKGGGVVTPYGSNTPVAVPSISTQRRINWLEICRKKKRG